MSNFTEKILKLFSWETFTRENIELFLSYAIIFFVFIPLKHTFIGQLSFYLGEYSDFTTISLYLSQIFIIFALSLLFISKKLQSPALYKITLFGLVAIVIYHFLLPEDYRLLSAFTGFSIMLNCLLVYFCVKSNLVLKYKDYFLYFMIILGLGNTLLSIIQFSLQQSIGLNFFGESPLSIFTMGVAKFVAHDTLYIRGYGLFPHPNIFGGLLVIISLLNLYLLTKQGSFLSRGILIFSYCYILFGILFSFSRGAILSFIVSTILYICLIGYHNRKILKKFYFLPILIAVAMIIMYPWFSSRATISDTSSNLRNTYNRAGIEIISKNWLLGTGSGTNVLHMKHVLQNKVDYWEVQPIHNFFLITISELGLIGVGFIIFLLYTSFRLLKIVLKEIKHRAVNIWHIALLTVVIAVAMLMMVDHYFYTYVPAQIILSLIISWVYAEVTNNVSRETQN